MQVKAANFKEILVQPECRRVPEKRDDARGHPLCRLRQWLKLPIVVSMEPQRSLDCHQVREEFVYAFGKESAHEEVRNRRLEQWGAECPFDLRPPASM